MAGLLCSWACVVHLSLQASSKCLSELIHCHDKLFMVSPVLSARVHSRVLRLKTVITPFCLCPLSVLSGCCRYDADVQVQSLGVWRPSSLPGAVRRVLRHQWIPDLSGRLHCHFTQGSQPASRSPLCALGALFAGPRFPIISTGSSKKKNLINGKARWSGKCTS